MPLVIDGYNLLKADMPPSLAGLDEARLCHVLQRAGFALRGVRVVFDGGHKPGLPAESIVPGIEFIYPGKGKSADDVIMDIIDADHAPRSLVVVSTDREIRKAARRRRAVSISSADFIRTLAASLARQPRHSATREKATQESLDDADVRRWLDEFEIKGD